MPAWLAQAVNAPSTTSTVSGWVTIGAGAVIILGFLGGVILWVLKQIVKNATEETKRTVAEATRPIQPNTNGGKSLSDLHAKVDTALDRLDRVEAEQSRVAQALAINKETP